MERPGHPQHFLDAVLYAGNTPKRRNAAGSRSARDPKECVIALGPRCPGVHVSRPCTQQAPRPTLVLQEADVTLTDARGNGPLHYACANQLESLGRLLVGRHDVDCALPNHQGNTPLHYACSSNSPALVKLLVAKSMPSSP